jgi:hypothetical protein
LSRWNRSEIQPARDIGFLRSSAGMSRSKRLKQAHDETNCTGPKQQEIPPRKIPGDGELRKECVTEETSQREKEPDP